jgi:hypothetical protein
MNNLRITNRKLSDGSVVHQVKFDAGDSLATWYTVTIEANDRKSAARIFDALNQDAAYVEVYHD